MSTPTAMRPWMSDADFLTTRRKRSRIEPSTEIFAAEAHAERITEQRGEFRHERAPGRPLRCGRFRSPRFAEHQRRDSGRRDPGTLLRSPRPP